MHIIFPKDLLEICIQNLLQSWDMDEWNLDSLLSQIPDPKDFPEVCASNSLKDDSTQASTSSKYIAFITIILHVLPNICRFFIAKSIYIEREES